MTFWLLIIAGFSLGIGRCRGQLTGSLHAFETGADIHGHQINPLDAHTEHLLPGSGGLLASDPHLHATSSQESGSGLLVDHGSVPHGNQHTSQDSMFGTPLGVALVHSKTKTSHIDEPGVHGNFLDVPVEHIVTDEVHATDMTKGTRPSTGHVLVDAKSPEIPIVSKQPGPLSGLDYVSGLAADYGQFRDRNLAHVDTTANTRSAAGKHSQHLGVPSNKGPHSETFGAQLGPATINSKELLSHIDPPGKHGNFLDVPVEHLVTGQTEVHSADLHQTHPDAQGTSFHIDSHSKSLPGHWMADSQGHKLPSAQSASKTNKPISGQDYMSRLVSGYSRSRTNEPSARLTFTNEHHDMHNSGSSGLDTKKVTVDKGHLNDGAMFSHGDIHGEPLGAALIKPKKVTSHIDPPGKHGNFLDVPVEHVVTGQTHIHTDSQPGHLSDSTAAGHGGILLDSSHGIMEIDHTGLLSSIGPDLNLPNIGTMGDPVGKSHVQAIKKTSHIDPPGKHGNFLDVPVEHIATGQTHIHTDTKPVSSTVGQGGILLDSSHGTIETGHTGLHSSTGPHHGEPLGAALVEPKQLISHTDPPGKHGNFLNVPVEHAGIVKPLQSDVGHKERTGRKTLIDTVDKTIEAALVAITGIQKPGTQILPFRGVLSRQGRKRGRSKIRPRNRNLPGRQRRINRRLNRLKKKRPNIRRIRQRNNRQRGRRFRGLIRGLAG